jgi:hypothetical protein
MGIKLFEKPERDKSKVDYEIDELVKELAEELTENQCKAQILEIYKDKNMNRYLQIQEI